MLGANPALLGIDANLPESELDRTRIGWWRGVERPVIGGESVVLAL
jgi:hypothetical protein